MQAEAQIWNDLLFVSGGALEISKCSFHLSSSDQDCNGTPILRTGTTAPNIYIMNGLVPSQVKQKCNLRSHKTLGCHVNPGNRMIAQKSVMTAKSDDYATTTATNILQQKESRTMHTSMYLPSVTYPMPVTSLTAVECDVIQHKFMQQIVPSLGFNRRMKLAIRYGLVKWGGAGLRQLYIEQGVFGVLMVLKHLRTPSGQPGKMLRIALSWAQAYAGISTFIWEDPSMPTPPHPARYIHSITTFLAFIQGQIILPTEAAIVPPRLHAHDQYIMDLAMLHSYPPHKIERINSCRRFLQAITLADISDADGTRLLPGVREGTRNPHRSTMTGKKFNQPRPPSSAWLTWRQFLDKCISNPGNPLKFPLREWIVPYHQCRHYPDFIHESTTNSVYHHKSHGQYQQTTPTDDRSRFLVHEDDPIQAAASGYPCQSHYDGHSCCILCNYIELIIESATFGIVTATATGTRLFHIRGATPGSRPQSFRAEGYSGLALVRLLIQLAQYTGIALHQSFMHFLDNTSVIKRVSKALSQSWTSPNMTLAPEWDLIALITSSYREPAHPADIHWVKGHQDNDRTPESLPLSAQLNC